MCYKLIPAGEHLQLVERDVTMITASLLYIVVPLICRMAIRRKSDVIKN